MPSIYKQQQITIRQNTWFALFILLGIAMIVGCILYSYRLFGDKVIERYTTYADLVPILNKVKQPLEAIRRAQNLEIPFPETPDVTKYISPEDDIKISESINNVNATFDLDFSQQLQNADLQELEAELLALRKKAAEINPDDPNTRPRSGIKHLSGTKLITYPGSGAPVVDLANPNTYRNFNIGVNSESGYCIVNQPFARPVEVNGIRQKDSIAQVQCNLADSTQWFSAKQINSNADLNKLLPVEKQIPAEYTLINYPFAVVQPNNGSGKECLTLNEDGLSVEPCNGSTDQRFAVVNAV